MKRKIVSESYKGEIFCTPQDLARFKKEEEIFAKLNLYIEEHKKEPFDEYIFIANIKKHFWVDMIISKDSIHIDFPTCFSMAHDLEILLIDVRDAVSIRILSDENPDCYDPNYARGLSVSVER